MMRCAVVQVGAKYVGCVNETWGCRTQPHEHMKAWACLLVSPTVTPVNS